MMPRSTSPIVTSYLDDSASTILSLTRSYGNVSWSAKHERHQAEQDEAEDAHHAAHARSEVERHG